MRYIWLVIYYNQIRFTAHNARVRQSEGELRIQPAVVLDLWPWRYVLYIHDGVVRDEQRNQGVEECPV